MHPTTNHTTHSSTSLTLTHLFSITHNRFDFLSNPLFQSLLLLGKQRLCAQPFDNPSNLGEKQRLPCCPFYFRRCSQFPGHSSLSRVESSSSPAQSTLASQPAVKRYTPCPPGYINLTFLFNVKWPDKHRLVASSFLSPPSV